MSLRLLPAISDEPLEISDDARISVGFGDASLTKDGDAVWSEELFHDYDECMTTAEAERRAAADPDHDWRVVLFAPLYGATYQRHSAGHWVKVEENRGFA